MESRGFDSRFVVVGAALALLATPWLRAESRFPPEIDHRLIETLQADRSRGGPAAADQGAWPAWRPSDLRCSGRGTWGRIRDGLARDQICNPVFENTVKIAAVLVSELLPAGSFGFADKLARLEGLAALADMPDAAFQCTAKLLTRLGPELFGQYLTPAAADRLRTDPVTQKQIDRAIEKVFDVKSLVDFVTNLRTLWTDGARALNEGENWVGEGWKTAKDTGNVPGWFEGFGEVIERGLGLKMDGMKARRELVAAQLDGCRVEEAERGWTSLLEESRGYLLEARAYLVWAEQEVYCSIPPPAAAPGEVDLAAWIASSPRRSTHEAALAHHRQVAAFDAELRADPRFAAAAFDRQRSKRDRFAQLARHYRDLASLPTAELACRDSSLAREIGDACFESALAGAGGSAGYHHFEQRLAHLAEGRRGVEAALTRGLADATGHLAACRLAAAREGFDRALADEQESLTPWALSLADFRPCFAPWPGDRLESDLRERERAIAEARTALSAQMASAHAALARCAWVEAQLALDAGRAALARPGCSDDSVLALETARLAAGEDALRERRSRIEPLRVEAEARRRDLAHAAEAAVFTTGSGALAERCDALARARAALDALAGFVDPTAAECLGAPPAADRRTELEIDLRRSAVELAAMLDELLGRARSAAARCDADTLATALRELETLPASCPGEGRASVGQLAARRREIERDRDHVRQVTPLLAGEWEAALAACDLAELAAVRNRVSIVRQNSCAWENLTRGERVALEELAGRTAGLGALVTRIEALPPDAESAPADLPATCLDRRPRSGAPADPGRDPVPPAGDPGWVGGSVQSVSSGGAAAPPAGRGDEGTPGARGEIDAIVALASPEQCRYVEALAMAERLAARLDPESADGRWLAGILPGLRRNAFDQRLAASSLAQALAAARADDPRAARRALAVAKQKALECQVPPIAEIDGELARAEEARRQADRVAFSDAMAGLLPTLVDVYNRGVAASAPPPSPPNPVRPSGSARGCDDPEAARTLYAGLDAASGRFLCSCPGHEFDARQGVCVHTGRTPGAGGAPPAVATGPGAGTPAASDAGGAGGDWAIVRIDRRWSETAAFCGGAARVDVVERNVTLYARGKRDATVAAWKEALRREDSRPGIWGKSGPCTCRRPGSGSVSVHRDNLSHEQAIAIWRDEIERLPGALIDFGVWQVPGAGDGTRTSIDTSQVCNLRG